MTTWPVQQKSRSLPGPGSLVTEFKVSYWLGATPRKIQWTNILAAVVSSITVTAAIMLFASTKGYVASAAHPNPMPAPQANAMAAVAP